jgi:uncharacterized protein (DUF1810 family)
MAQLERFKEAQDRADSGFESALAELRAGRKQGHWIWYVFPQLAGLGSSTVSQAYGIDGVAEAVTYLRDPVLRSRLLTVTVAVAERARGGVSLQALMNSSIDVRKLVSSLTLFGAVAKRLYAADRLAAYQTIACTAVDILAAAGSEGYPPCDYTLAQLRRTGA